ncbi:MAG: SAM-dependent methyltransferase [Polyangiaceae bacterium]|jgi:SAM-dependent methyltransferase|nr:SAM-dependent methyltransferase [Polyangiaceae bacterium]
MAAPSMTAVARLHRALDALLPVIDILDGPIDGPEPPGWCEARGWGGFLLSLDPLELKRCEVEGLAAALPSLAGAPVSLVALGEAVTRACELPALRRPLAPPRAALRAVGERKGRQLAMILGAIAPMAERASRIVDVGAGAGHLTRLVAELFERDALGIDRDEALLRRAAGLQDARERQAGALRARFERVDACREPLLLRGGDLAVGLHACGTVGDLLAQAAAGAGCGAALISCCFQKIPGPVREPLSRAGSALRLQKASLGLANLTSRPEGVEDSIEQTLAARQARHALFLLLRSRGLDLAPGEAMRGINRRRAHKGLVELAGHALRLRGLEPATEDELRFHELEGARQHEHMRRLALPRHMLSRLVEVLIVLDRAACLEEAGLDVQVQTFCDQADSPRNTCILAAP